MAANRRIEELGKNNYNLWRIQIEVLLVKPYGWNYVFALSEKPERSQTDIAKWELGDRKARSDLILSMSTSELRQIKD